MPSHHTRSELVMRLQNMIFAVLFLLVIVLLGWLGVRYQTEFDLTWGQRNSLTQASVDVLAEMDGPVTITAFVRDESTTLRDNIQDVVGRYQRHKADITLEFINPDMVPQMVREHGISIDGELLVQMGPRQETLQAANERNLTNLLLRLASQEIGFIGFVEGHGERQVLGKANHGLGDFARHLADKGFQIQPVNLARTAAIAENIRVLVIASPRSAYLPGEVAMIEGWLEKGGNLLWLTEPGADDGLDALAAALDVQRLPGVIVDTTSRLFGIADPTFAIVTDYPRHELTEALHSQTLFPEAVGLESREEAADEAGDQKGGWSALPILQTLPRSWTETGKIEGDVRYDPQTTERAGPITIGMLLQRLAPQTGAAADGESTAETQPAMQRVMVIGDGDFLSNTYLGNGQNLNLGVAVLQWLSNNDRFVDIGTLQAPDTQLEIGQAGALVILALFLGLLPLGLLVTGVVIWWKRRSR